MGEEPVNCWFVNSMNTFDLEIYQKEDRDSQYIDMLMMLGLRSWRDLLISVIISQSRIE